jgi:hypothetical protein
MKKDEEAVLKREIIASIKQPEPCAHESIGRCMDCIAEEFLKGLK